MEYKRVLFAFYTQFSLFPPPLEFASIANEIVGTSVVIFSSSFLSFLDFHVSAICTASRFLFPIFKTVVIFIIKSAGVFLLRRIPLCLVEHRSAQLIPAA